MSLRHRHCLCLLLLLAVVLAGCGSSSSGTNGSDSGTTSQSAPPEVDVTVAQIERSKAGSPERTVLEWWRDIQLNDARHALDLYLEPPAFPDLAGQFNFVAGRLDGKVMIVSSSREEDGSTVVEVRWTPPSGNAREVSLRLGEQGNQWKLSEASFVDEMVARLQQTESKE